MRLVVNTNAHRKSVRAREARKKGGNKVVGPGTSMVRGEHSLENRQKQKQNLRHGCVVVNASGNAHREEDCIRPHTLKDPRGNGNKIESRCACVHRDLKEKGKIKKERCWPRPQAWRELNILYY
jgi:hypothetical protein